MGVDGCFDERKFTSMKVNGSKITSMKVNGSKFTSMKVYRSKFASMKVNGGKFISVKVVSTFANVEIYFLESKKKLSWK